MTSEVSRLNHLNEDSSCKMTTDILQESIEDSNVVSTTMTSAFEFTSESPVIPQSSEESPQRTSDKTPDEMPDESTYESAPESTTEVISEILTKVNTQSPNTPNTPSSPIASAASPIVSPPSPTSSPPSESQAMATPMDDSSPPTTAAENFYPIEDYPNKLTSVNDVENVDNVETCENHEFGGDCADNSINVHHFDSDKVHEESEFLEMDESIENLHTQVHEDYSQVNLQVESSALIEREETVEIEENNNLGLVEREIEQHNNSDNHICEMTNDISLNSEANTSLDDSAVQNLQTEASTNVTKKKAPSNRAKGNRKKANVSNSTSFSTSSHAITETVTVPLSKAEQLHLEAKALLDSLNRMKKRNELSKKYHYDRVVYDPITSDLKKVSELHERSNALKSKFNKKLKNQPKLHPDIQPEILETSHIPASSQRRLEYYNNVVKVLNHEDDFKKEYQKKIKEEKRQKRDEMIFTKKVAEFQEKEIEELKSIIKEKKRKSIKAALAAEERREIRDKERRRSRSTHELGRMRSAQDLKKTEDSRGDEQKNRWDGLVSKINYPRIKIKKQPTLTLTEFQQEISKKQAEKREPTQSKEINYLSEMKRLRKRAVKRRKLLAQKKAAREKKRLEELRLARLEEEKAKLAELSAVEESVTVEQEAVVEEIVIPTSKKRQFILEEIYNTEKDYVTHLLHLIERYAVPIKENNLLPETIQDTLFSALIVIKDVHVNMMEELELFRNENFLDPIEPGGIKGEKGLSLGNIFLEIAPAFKQYTDYINDYEKMYDIVTKSSKKYKKFYKFCQQETQRRMEANDRLTDLPDYLILPIQRIPRYRMLLEDLVKNTSEEHPDYVATKEALQLIIDIADYCNAMKKEKQNRERMEQLIRLLKIKELNTPKRRFIREGVVKIPVPGSKKQKEGTFYLFSDICVLKIKKPIVIRLFDAAAQEYKVEVAENASEPTFNLMTGPNLQTTQPIICQSNYDLNEWIAHFNTCHSLEDPIGDVGFSNLDSDVITTTSTSDLISTTTEA